MCIFLRHICLWQLEKETLPLYLIISPLNIGGPLAWENQDLNWCNCAKPALHQTLLSFNACFPFTVNTGCSRRCCNIAAGSCRCEQRGLWRSFNLLDSTTFPPQPELPPHKSASRKPAVGVGRKEEVIFYIRAVNHSSMLCIFPMVVLAAWLTERLAGCMRRNVLWNWPLHWGTDWETETGGCWVITWPRGCLFKPKSCLDYCTQTLLL